MSLEPSSFCTKSSLGGGVSRVVDADCEQRFLRVSFLHSRHPRNSSALFVLLEAHLLVEFNVFFLVSVEFNSAL